LQITNNTTNEYQLSQYYQLAPSATGFVVADSDYAGKTDLKNEIDQLLKAGSITVTSAPAGYSVVGNALQQTPAAGTTEQSASASATAAVATATIAAGGAGVHFILDRVELSFSVAPAAPVLATVKDGASGSVLWEEEITGAGSQVFELSAEKIRGSANTALVASLPSGGGSAVGVVNLYAHEAA
jgi:hypothetical protein